MVSSVKTKIAILTIFAACVSTKPLAAVGTEGKLVGFVTDPTHAVVLNAQVTIRNQETGVERRVQTDLRGEFTAPLLPPGLYQISVEKEGFHRPIYRDIQLNVDQTVRFDIVLQLGEASEQIEVIASVLLLQTDTSNLGQVVDQQRVSALPLNQRNFLNFTLLAPGAQIAADGSQSLTQGGAVSANGAREQANNFLLDGVDNNDQSFNQYAVLPSIDAIQEFKVQSNNSSAEFGRSGGAQINVVLKKGTNDLHGSFFEFLRNRTLDARNFFDLPDCSPESVSGSCGDIPRYDRNQFGATLGGRIIPNQTFFFVSYEGLHLREATTRGATVPSRLQREAAFRAVPAAERNSAGQAVLSLYPAANVGSDLTNSTTFFASPTIRSSVNQFAFNADHRISDSNFLSGHYALFDEDRFDPYPVSDDAFTNLPGFGTFRGNRGQSARVSWIHIFGSQLISESRFGFNHFRGTVIQENSDTNVSQELGFPSISSNPMDWGFPNVTVAGFDGIGELINTPQIRKPTTFHYAGNLAWNPGFHDNRHQLKLGTDIRRIRFNGFLDFLARGNWLFLGGISGEPLVDLLRGTPDLVLAGTGNASFGLRTTSINFYIQDNVRLLPRLTLNLGLRYEYNGPPVDVHDKYSTPDFSPQSVTCNPKPGCQFIVAGTNGVTRSIIPRDTNNFAPRVGFAFRPFATDRFVVRSAYGIFYDVTLFNVNVGPNFNPPFFQLAVFPNTGVNTIQNILDQPGFSPPTVAQMLDPNFRDAYLQHWNLNLQYELHGGLKLDAAYVGSKGTSLVSVRDINQPHPGDTAGPFPQFGTIASFEPRASSMYNALQLRAEKSFSRGIMFLAAYTWSKSIDDASTWGAGNGAQPGFPQDSFNLRADRALSTFHTKHRLVLSHLQEIPAGAGRRWLQQPGLLHHLLGNWQVGAILAFQTGRPFTVNRNIDQSLTGTGFGFFDRPDQIADPFRTGAIPNHPDSACRLTVSQGGRAVDTVRDPAGWFNPCAFAAPATPRFGSAGRNSLIGPGLANLDLSLTKEIPLHGETHRLQLRFEFFNLFNHPNFNTPNRIFDSARFTAVESSNAFGNRPPRQIQLGLRYSF